MGCGTRPGGGRLDRTGSASAGVPAGTWTGLARALAYSAVQTRYRRFRSTAAQPANESRRLPVSEELTIYNQRLARPTLTSTSTGVASRHPRTLPATPSRSIWMRMESVLVSPKLLWLVVLLGVVVRVRQYAANRSLWLDESLVALNIIGRGMHRLLTAPLDFNQTAPAGFLFVEKLSAELFDKGEYALRAFPLLCGIVGLLLYPKLALRVVGPVGAVQPTSSAGRSDQLMAESSYGSSSGRFVEQVHRVVRRIGVGEA